MLEMDFGPFKDWMVLRLLQLTSYIDYYLYQEGFNRQTEEQKEEILKVIGIYVKNTYQEN